MVAGVGVQLDGRKLKNRIRGITEEWVAAIRHLA